MKPLLKTFIGIGAGTLIAGAGIGAYFAIQSTQEKQERVSYVLGAKSGLKFDIKDDISAPALKIFKQMVEAQQFSGSEEIMLKKIVIGPGQLPGDNGEYINGVITINSKKIMSRYNFENDFDLAYYMYQIYSHEYLHFVADTYLKDAASSLKEKKFIFKNDFINEFKKLLNYDRHTIKYSGADVKPGYKSKGSIYDAKDLYDFANNNKPLNAKTEPGYKYVMAPIDPTFVVDRHHVITDKSIEYIYSASELFARKYMLINTDYHPTLNNNMNSMEGFRPDGFINFKDKSGKRVTGASSYLEDVFNFKRNLNSNEGVYLQDNPFAAKVGLEKLYAKVIGDQKNQIMIVKHFAHDKTEMIAGNALLESTNGHGIIPESDYGYIGFINTKTLKPTLFEIKTNRKVQVMGDGTFITRDTFFTRSNVPVGTSSQELFLYSNNKIKGPKLSSKK